MLQGSASMVKGSAGQGMYGVDTAHLLYRAGMVVRHSACMVQPQDFQPRLHAGKLMYGTGHTRCVAMPAEHSIISKAHI